MIRVDNLYKSFNGKKVVSGVTFVARNGEITGLLGPNGAGKTTTLRMLYTLMQPDSGNIFVDNINTKTDAHEVRRRLGVLPDARALYRRLTARENIQYYADLHGLPLGKARERAEQLFGMLGMCDIADRRTDGFSQGERVKTALARALIHDPQNIVLDEPANGLDVMTTRSLREFLLNQKSHGRCILLSSHIMQEVTALCDRIVIITNGLVVADAPPDQLRQQTNKDNLEEAFVELIGAAAIGGMV